MKWPLMSPDEIHRFGIDAILDHMKKKEAVTVEAVIGELRRDPQIVGQRWGMPAFVFVRTAMYPDKGVLSDREFMRLLAWADKHTANAFFASVGLCCSRYPDRSPVKDEKDWSFPVRNAGFFVAYEGLQVMKASDRVKVVR